jgi:hypothetical protein
MDRSWSLAGGHGHGTPQGQPGHRDQALGGWLVEPAAAVELAEGLQPLSTQRPSTACS